MERSTMCEKTHYFDWAIFNSKVLDYWRVFNISTAEDSCSTQLDAGCLLHQDQAAYLPS